MNDLLFRFLVYAVVIVLVSILCVLIMYKPDIRVTVWLRLTISLIILVIGDFLLFKYYHAVGSWGVFRIVSVILITYACFDIPAKIAGIYYKRKLAIDDFSMNPFDRQLEKLGYKPLFLGLLLALTHFIGCNKIGDYYETQLRQEGIEQNVVIYEKDLERIRKNYYDSVVRFSFSYKGTRYKSFAICRGLNIGDTATMRFTPHNPANCELTDINRTRIFEVMTIKIYSDGQPWNDLPKAQ